MAGSAGAGNADVQLTVELIPQQTAQDLKSQIDRLTAGVKPNPIKVKLQLDDGKDVSKSLTQLGDKINNLTNGQKIKAKIDDSQVTKTTNNVDSLLMKLDRLSGKMKNTTSGLSSSLGQDLFGNISSQIQSLTSEISDLKTSLESLKGINLNQNQNITPASNGALTNNFTEITNRLDAINNAISGVTSSLGSIGNALSTAPVTSFTSSINTACDAINKLKESLDKLNTGKLPKSKNNLTDADNYKKAKAIVKDYFDYLTKLNTTENDIFTDAAGKYTSKSGNYKYLAEELNRTAEAYQKLDTVTKQLSPERQKMVIDAQLEAQTKYNLALEETANKQRAAANKTQQDLVNKQYKDSVKAIKDYYKALNTLASSGNTDVVPNSSGDYFSKSGKFNALASAINSVKQKYDSLKASMNSLPMDKQASLIEIENEKLSERSVLLEKIDLKTKEALKIPPGSNEYIEDLNKINALFDRIQKNLKSWSAAKSGKTHDAYNQLKQQLDELTKLQNRLIGGNINKNEFSTEFNTIAQARAKAEKEIIDKGENRQSFFAGLGDMAKKFTSYLGVSRIIMTAVNSAKELVTASMAIEDSMAQLRIVTGASDAEMASFFSEATELAKGLGKSIEDVTASIETFSRLGYNLSDSSALAKYANILSNVADVSADAATTGLTSIIKGYGMDVSEAEHVSDVLVKVGQEYAISAEELMEAFERGGAAMYASGTSFEKTAALFAATNAALQNASTVGTMWKTVSARIRGATTELEEMGEETEGLSDGLSKYREEIKSLSGVDIMVNDTTYKDMYDIFVELAQAWDSMNGGTAQARVAEILGGTRNLSGIMSTINNIKDAIGAYEGAMDSAGTATKANEIYMDTTSAHISQLKASFQELAKNVVDSDLTKGVVDFGTTFVGLSNNIAEVINTFGGLKTVIIGVAGAFALIKRAEIANTFSNIAKRLTGLKSGLTTIADSFKSFVTVLKSLKAGTALSGGSSLSSIFTVLKPAAGVAVGAITLVIGAIAALKQARDQYLREQVDKASTNTSSRQKDLDNLQEQVDRARELRAQLDAGNLSEQETYNIKTELLSIQQELVSTYGSQASQIDLINGKLDAQLATVQEINREEASRYLSENREGLEVARREMEKDLGENREPLVEFGVGSVEGDTILDLIKDYEGFETVDSGGVINLYFHGDAEQAKETLADLLTDIRKVQKDGGFWPMLDAFSDSLSSVLSEADDIVKMYGDMYKMYQLNTLFEDDTKRYTQYGTPGNVVRTSESHTLAEWLSLYTTAVEEYNDALATGIDIPKYAEQFKELDNTIGVLTKGKWYEGIFGDVREGLNQTLVDYNNFVNALKGEDSDLDDALTNRIKSHGDKLKEYGLTDTDFKHAFFTGGTQTGEVEIRALVSAAMDAGLILADSFDDVTEGSIQPLINTLFEVGDLSVPAAEGVAEVGKTFRELIENEDTVKFVDEFQSDMSTISDAIKQMSEDGDVNIADLMQQFDGLTGNVDSLIMELSQIQIDEISSFYSTWTKTMNDLTDPDQIKQADDFFKSLMSSLDFSNIEIDVDDIFKNLVNGAITQDLTDEEIDLVNAYQRAVEAREERVAEYIGQVDVMHRKVTPSITGEYNVLDAQVRSYKKYGIDKEGAFIVTPILPDGERIENIDAYIQEQLEKGIDVEGMPIYLDSADDWNTAAKMAAEMDESVTAYYQAEIDALEAVYGQREGVSALRAMEADDLKTTIEAYKEYTQARKSLPEQTVFGNVDAMHRDAAYGEYGSFGIAYTPQLVDEDGNVEFLTPDALSEYINSVIDKAKADNDLSKEHILDLDANGIRVNGQLIKGIIADVGATSKETADQMKSMGDTKAASKAYYKLNKEAKKYGTTVEEIVDNLDDTYEIDFQSPELREQLQEIEKAFESELGTRKGKEIMFRLSLDPSNADWTIEEWKKRYENEAIELRFTLAKSNIEDTNNQIKTLEDAIAESSQGYLNASTIQGVSQANGMYRGTLVNTVAGMTIDVQKAKALEKQQQELNLTLAETAKQADELTFKKNEEEMLNLAKGAENLNRILSEHPDGEEYQRIYDLSDANDTLSQHIAYWQGVEAEIRGSISLLNEYNEAQSTPNPSDAYNSIYAGMENAKKLYDQGWIGKDDFTTYAELIAGYGETGDKAVDNFVDNMTRMERYLTDDSQGLINFLDDATAKTAELGQTWVTQDENGAYRFDIGNMNEFAEAMDMNTELVTHFFLAMKDLGLEVNLDWLGEALSADLQSIDLTAEDAVDRIASVIRQMKELSGEGIDIGGIMDPLLESLRQLKEQGADIDWLVELINSIGDVQIDPVTLEIVTEETGQTVEEIVEENDGKTVTITVNEQPGTTVETPEDGETTTTTVNVETEEVGPTVDEIVKESDGKTVTITVNAEQGTTVEGTQGVDVTTTTNNTTSENETKTVDYVIGTQEAPDDKLATVTYANNAKDQGKPLDQTADVSYEYKDQDDPKSRTADLHYEWSTQDPAKAAVADLSYKTVYQEPPKKMIAPLQYVVSPLPAANPIIGTTNASGTVISRGKQLTAGEIISAAREAGTALRLNGAFSFGSDWKLPHDEDALVNELGNESIVRDGRWMLLNGKAHVEHLKKGDIIFSAKQTEELLKYGKAISDGGRGTVAMSTGTAVNNMSAYADRYGSGASGGGSPKEPTHEFDKDGGSGSGKNYGNNNSSNSSKNAQKEVDKFFDHIVERLDDLQDKTDKYIQKAENATSVKTRMSYYQKAIGSTQEQIDANKQAQKDYMAQAGRIVSSSGGRLTPELIKKIQEGTLDMAEAFKQYDSETMQFIQDYQDLYENAEKCSENVGELNAQLKDLAMTKLDALSERTDTRLEKLQGSKDLNNAKLEYLDSKGSKSKKTRKALYRGNLEADEKTLEILRQTYNDYSKELQRQMEDGNIEKYDDHWYEAMEYLNSLKVQIYETKTSMNEANKAIEDLKKPTGELFDHIQEYLDDLSTKSDDYVSKAENAPKLNAKLKYYQKGIDNMDVEMDANRIAAERYREQANQVVKESKGKLTPDIIKRIENGSLTKDNAFKYYDEDLTELIGRYQEFYEQAEACDQAVKDIAESQRDLAKTKLDTIVDRYSLKIEKAQVDIDRNNARLQYRDTVGKSNVGATQRRILENSAAHERETLEKTANARALLEKELKQQMDAGLIREYDDAWYEAQNQLEEYTKNMYESEAALAEFEQQIRQIEITKIQRVVDAFSRLGDLIASKLGLKEARGENVTEADYMSQVTNNNDKINSNDQLLQKLLEERTHYDPDSEKYQELTQSISDVKNENLQLFTENEKLKDLIVEERWESFNDLQDAVDQTITELDFMKDMLNEPVDMMANITEEGHARIALIGEAMKNEKQTIADYNKAIEKLGEDLANGNISQDEYNEKLIEFQSVIRDSVQAVRDYEQELIDIWIDQAETRNQLLQDEITLRQDALQSMKDYHDYAKTVKDKTGDIDSLKAQIAALEGVTNAADRAQLRKLKADLKEAEEELDEINYEHEYELKITGYDRLKEEAQTQLDIVLDALSTNADMQRNVVGLMLSDITTNYQTAYGVVNDLVTNTGLSISQMTQSSIQDFNSMTQAAMLAAQAAANAQQYSPSDTANGIDTGHIDTFTDSNGNSTKPAEENAGMDPGLQTQQALEQYGNNAPPDEDTLPEPTRPEEELKPEPKKVNKKQVKQVIQSGRPHPKPLTADERARHHEVWEYITEKHKIQPWGDYYYELLADALAVDIKDPDNMTKAEKNAILAALKANGFAKGGYVDSYIPVDPATAIGSIVTRNGDKGFVSVAPGEYILNANQTDRFLDVLEPAISNLNSFNKAYEAMASGTGKTSGDEISFDSVIKVMGDLDKDIYEDIEALGKQLIQSKNFTDGITSAVGRTVKRDATKLGMRPRI